MTQPSDRTIRELVNDLYHRLDIGSRPRSAEARLLEQITLAADALEGRGNALERFAIAQREYIAAAKPSVGVPIDWPEVSAEIDRRNREMGDAEIDLPADPP